MTDDERRARRAAYLKKWARSERNRRYYLAHRGEIIERRRARRQGA